MGCDLGCYGHSTLLRSSNDFYGTAGGHVGNMKASARKFSEHHISCDHGIFSYPGYSL